LKRKIRKEFNQIKIILALAVENKEKVNELRQVLKKEKKKQIAYTAVGGTMFLVPLAGTALLLLSKAVFNWLNEITPNYKKLLALIS
jgi:hypothetical protein